MNGLMTIVVRLEYTSVHIIKAQTAVARERQRSAETVLITIFGAKSAQKQGHKISKPLKFSSLPQKLVSKMRLELTRPNGHYPLKVARLPIPPPGHLG